MRASRFLSRVTPLLSLSVILFAIALLAGLCVSSTPAEAQGSDCINGQNCCVVAMSLGPPRRYAVACDGGAQTAMVAASMSGYTNLVFGPASFDRCAAWMGNAGIPGWEQARNPAYNDVAPPPDSSCTPGQNCCYIGANSNMPPQYAIAYDGAAFTGSHSLAMSGYTHIVYGPVSAEACHAYWNRNIAGGGFNTPSGAVPVSSTGGAASGPRSQSRGWSGPPQPGASISLSISSWQQAPNYIGTVTNAQAGLRLQGGAFTNGRLVNGVYDGNRIRSRELINLSTGGDIYVTFSADGGGSYMAFWPRLLTGTGVPAFSTHHSWNSSIVVTDRAPLYGHLRVDRGGAYRFSVATGAYDDHGGSVIGRSSGTLANPSGYLDFQMGDNYAGNRASMTISEVWVYHDSGQPQQRQNEDAICLLGVCAPKSN